LNSKWKHDLPPVIFFDLDGVCADFEYGLLTRFGIEIARVTDDEMWSYVNQWEEEGNEWFTDLPLMMSGYQIYLDLVKHYPDIQLGVCSATGRSEEYARVQKLKYVENHMPATRPELRHIVRKSEHKAAFAAPHHILIDDNFPRSITGWEAAGGIGIHHLNYHHTKWHLSQLGIVLP
jgi:hypothetical protein